MSCFEEKIKEIESIERTQYYTEFVTAFNEVKYWAESNGMVDEARLAQYELEICSLRERNPILSKDKKESRLVPKFVYQDGTEFPDIKQFLDEQFKYYEKRLFETNNVFLKVRYSDFLFEYGNEKITNNKYQISQYLLESLFEIIEHYRDNEEDINRFVATLARFVEVSLLMGNKQKLNEAIRIIGKQLTIWNDKTEYTRVFQISNLIRTILRTKFKNEVSEEVTTLNINVLENARNKSFEEKNYEFHRMICEELIEYRKLKLISLERERELLLEIGQSYELESEDQQGRMEKDLSVKAHFLELAMRHYANIGEKDKINEMKILIKQAYEQYEQSGGMKEISVSTSIPTDILNSIIDFYISSDIQNSLDKLAYSGEFIPNIVGIEKQTNEMIKKFPLESLISKSIIKDGKKVDHTLTEEDYKNFSFNRNYSIHLHFILELFIKPIYERLISDYKLNADEIMEKFNRWGWLDYRNRPFVEIGIKKFFEDDFISALHILVPQFESLVRRFFDKAGFPTTSIKKGTAQNEETFNEFLNREDIKSALGDNVHKLIQFVMVEQNGLNLRNEIAHGLIKISDITKSKCILVIYLFLVLTRYRINIE